MASSGGMCQRYSVIAPELAITASHHTRGRCAQRGIAGPAAIANAHIMIAWPASSSDGGVPRVDRCRNAGEEEQRHDLKHTRQGLEHRRRSEQVARDEHA